MGDAPSFVAVVCLGRVDVAPTRADHQPASSLSLPNAHAHAHAHAAAASHVVLAPDPASGKIAFPGVDDLAGEIKSLRESRVVAEGERQQQQAEALRLHRNATDAIAGVRAEQAQQRNV